MNLPINTEYLNPADVSRFQQTYDLLKKHFAVQFTGHIDFNLEQFEVFKHYTHISTLGSLLTKHDHNNDSYILFVQAVLRKKDPKGLIEDHTECQTWALAYVKRDFGRVLIKRETLADKIIELVHPIELDFDDDKAFSDTFYVLTDDRDKAVKAMDRNFRNAVMDIRGDELVIEVVNHTLIAGSKSAATPEKVIYMADFIRRVCSSC